MSDEEPAGVGEPAAGVEPERVVPVRVAGTLGTRVLGVRLATVELDLRITGLAAALRSLSRSLPSSADEGGEP